MGNQADRAGGADPDNMPPPQWWGVGRVAAAADHPAGHRICIIGPSIGMRFD